MMLKFSSFGRMLGYHDENCTKRQNSIGNCPAKNSGISEFSENSELSPWPDLTYFSLINLCSPYEFVDVQWGN